MFGRLVYDILFFAIPSTVIALFIISLYRYISAKKLNRQVPDTFSDEEIKRRKVFLTVTSIIAATFVLVVVGFIALLFMAVAFM